MEKYRNRIVDDPKANVSLAREILKAYEINQITKDEKNNILSAIIEKELLRNQKILNVGFIQNRCPTCAGRGFTIIPEMEMKYEAKNDCVGDPERGILSCNGTGIKTMLCQRCNGISLKSLIEKERDKLEKIPSDAFVHEHGHETFRLIEADEMGNTKGKYWYIPKKPCNACSGTGRFVYKSEKRTVPCVCVHKTLVPTGRIKTRIECNNCHGDGRRIDNPVIKLDHLPNNVKAVIESLITK